MSEQNLPESLESVFKQFARQPEALFEAMLPVLCDVLQADRCFIHVRNPYTRVYRSFCWRRSLEFPDISTAGWEPEMQWEQDDPMFAAALRTEPSIFVEDVEAASSTTLNREFERQHLGHRALIHAHITQDNLLWGILQPSVMAVSRQWNEVDRSTVLAVVEWLRPFVQAYVTAAGV